MSGVSPGAAAIRCEPWDIGTGVAGYAWRAPNPRAVLLRQHGYGHYARQYLHGNAQLIRHLLNVGVSVYAFDTQGVIRARLLARSETTRPRRRRLPWLARRAHRPVRDVRR